MPHTVENTSARLIYLPIPEGLPGVQPRIQPLAPLKTLTFVGAESHAVHALIETSLAGLVLDGSIIEEGYTAPAAPPPPPPPPPPTPDASKAAASAEADAAGSGPASGSDAAAARDASKASSSSADAPAAGKRGSK